MPIHGHPTLSKREPTDRNLHCGLTYILVGSRLCCPITGKIWFGVKFQNGLLSSFSMCSTVSLRRRNNGILKCLCVIIFF